MTKKDFEGLALGLRRARMTLAGITPDLKAVHNIYVGQVALVLEQSSPAFDHSKFRAACGLED